MGIGNKVANNRSVGTGAARPGSSPPPRPPPRSPCREGPASPGRPASGSPLRRELRHTMGGNVVREPQLLPGHAGGRPPFVGEEGEERRSSDILPAQLRDPPPSSRPTGRAAGCILCGRVVPELSPCSAAAAGDSRSRRDEDPERRPKPRSP